MNDLMIILNKLEQIPQRPMNDLTELYFRNVRSHPLQELMRGMKFAPSETVKHCLDTYKVHHFQLIYLSRDSYVMNFVKQ